MSEVVFLCGCRGRVREAELQCASLNGEKIATARDLDVCLEGEL